jgi:thioredoxin reductase (NADPH)
VKVRHIPTGKLTPVRIDGVFIFIGYVPNTGKLRGGVELNPAGEIVVSPMLETSVPGVYAAGDAVTKRFRQITTAVADGTVAALAAMEYLRAREAVPAPAPADVTA